MYLKYIIAAYVAAMVFTYGHAANHFKREAIEACEREAKVREGAYCSGFDMIHRPEAFLFSALWPYYWSERLTEGQ